MIKILKENESVNDEIKFLKANLPDYVEIKVDENGEINNDPDYYWGCSEIIDYENKKYNYIENGKTEYVDYNENIRICATVKQGKNGLQINLYQRDPGGGGSLGVCKSYESFVKSMKKRMSYLLENHNPEQIEMIESLVVIHKNVLEEIKRQFNEGKTNVQ